MSTDDQEALIERNEELTVALGEQTAPVYDRLAFAQQQVTDIAALRDEYQAGKGLRLHEFFTRLRLILTREEDEAERQADLRAERGADYNDDGHLG